MELTKTKTIYCLPFFRPQRHDLYEASKDFHNGKWWWAVEIARGKILAYAVSYQSHESPTLDTGWREMHGRSEFLDSGV
jgi:hypothetical protein